MRRISRIDRPIGQLRIRPNLSSRPPYLCTLCKSQASAFSTTTLRAADKKLPFTEKIRRKIWGTDNPPGLEDPYGGRSQLDRTYRRPKKQEEDEDEDEDDIEEIKAKRELSLAADLGSYEPATTWKGLNTVGDIEEEWDPEHVYNGFAPEGAPMSGDEATAALHRAVVEIFALKEAGLPLSGISNAEPNYDITTGVQITPSELGATLEFTDEVWLDDILESLDAQVDETADKGAPIEFKEDIAAERSEVDSLDPKSESAAVDETPNTNPTESEEDIAADRSTEGVLAAPIQYSEIVATWDPAWLQVSLADPEVKFAVMKRTMQLTGFRFSDADINSSHTVQALLSHLVEPPKPKKVIDALLVKEELLTLPNVSVYPSRITPIDKERNIIAMAHRKTAVAKVKGLPPTRIQPYRRGTKRARPSDRSPSPSPPLAPIPLFKKKAARKKKKPATKKHIGDKPRGIMKAPKTSVKKAPTETGQKKAVDSEPKSLVASKGIMKTPSLDFWGWHSYSLYTPDLALVLDDNFEDSTSEDSIFKNWSSEDSSSEDSSSEDESSKDESSQDSEIGVDTTEDDRDDLEYNRTQRTVQIKTIALFSSGEV
ncbi:hypothetical protein B7494_g1110 [Chlorociboria aeruginascens]|nr:hypothetical protein B7494_g1110 [Chlorociboria aeruginascens]